MLASNPMVANLYHFLGLSSNRLKTVHPKLSLSINMKNDLYAYAIRSYKPSAQLFPNNDTDKEDEDEDDGSSHHTLFVHPR